ncbi:MAG TPA: hypothetical protein VIM70_10685 [Clostridium sp.]|uniref:hypothetical protein n=1 Tax=Clostridium sp. TaxID=1506 RepID=UPI002F94983B
MPYDFVGEIKSVLNCNIFDEDDFLITNSISEDIYIKYIYSNNNYNFHFKIPSKKEEVAVNDGLYNTAFRRRNEWIYVFRGSISPGRYNIIENFSFHGFEDVKKEIKLWKNYLHEELEKLITNFKNTDTTPHKSNKEFDIYISRFDDIEKQIDEQIDDNEMFSQEEKESFNDKLNEMQIKFEEQLKAIILDKNNLKIEIDKLNEDFLKLKSSLEIMSKKNWCRKFVRKTKDFLKDPNKRGIMITLLKFGGKFLEQFNINIPLLGEGIKAIEQISDSK